jgi:hypothetical protein
MLCPLCEKRKPKRYCPGVAKNICPQCCGTYREVTIDCPSACPYLRESRRQHAERFFASDGPVYPEIDVSETFLRERETLISGMAYTVVQYASANRALVDPDVINALDHFIRTVATLRSGVIYESLPTGALREALYRALQAFVKEYQKEEGKQMTLDRVRDSDIHRAAVFVARLGQMQTNGRPLSRAFIDYLRTHFFPDFEAQQQGASALVLP